MEKILIYIGLNEGKTFSELIDKYERVIGFEPIPDLANMMIEKYVNVPKVEIICAAITDEDGEYEFFLAGSNLSSSSLYELSDEYRNTTGNMIFTSEKITVKGINLSKFLKERGITEIDTYISDTESQDFTILLQLKDFIDEKRIRKIQVEADNDEFIPNIHYNQPNNKESLFMELLLPNYDLTYVAVEMASKDLTFEIK